MCPVCTRSGRGCEMRPPPNFTLHTSSCTHAGFFLAPALQQKWMVVLDYLRWGRWTEDGKRRTDWAMWGKGRGGLPHHLLHSRQPFSVTFLLKSMQLCEVFLFRNSAK